MTANGWFQILCFFALILLVTKPLGLFMARVFNRERTFLDPVLGPIERLIYRLTRVDATREMRWTEYAAAMLLFSLVSMLVLYLLQRLQGFLPLNPQQLPGVDSAGYLGSAFNTAASFTTNTNWQSYVPETTMSYLTQMAGLAYHNFVSAAVGISLAIAFIRGIARKLSQTIGNFWVDMTRAAVWVCLPLCIVGALLLVADGVPQNLRPYDKAQLVDKTDAITEQVIAQGPVASQEIIKEWGTNGGGFFNVNSAHPFENPTPFTNLLEMLAIFAVSAGLTYTLGRMTGSQKHGWAVLSEILYAFTSGTGNNGSAFAGISANTIWYNTTLGMAMLIGRFMMIVPMLAVAGSLACKNSVPPSLGTFPVTTPLFTTLLVSVVVIVGALTFFPALSLGPIVEELLMRGGKAF